MTTGEFHQYKRPEVGFSLVEALIALAIIAGMTGALLETAAQAAHARSAMGQRRQALLVARSALDRAAAGDGADTGQWQALTWHIARRPYGPGDPLGQAQLEQLTLTVTGADRQPLVMLTTVHIRP